MLNPPNDRGQKVLICSEQDVELPSEEGQDQQEDGGGDRSNGLPSEPKCKSGDWKCNYMNWEKEMYAIDKLPVWDGTPAKHVRRRGNPPVPDVYSDLKPSPQTTPKPGIHLLREPIMTAPPYSRSLHPPLPGWGEFTIIDSKGVTLPVHPVDKKLVARAKPHPADMEAEVDPLRDPAPPQTDVHQPRTAVGRHMPAVRHASERDKKPGDKKSGGKKAEDKKETDTKA